MARNAAGQFVPGGRGGSSDQAPSLPMENFLNVAEVPITFGVDSTTETFATIQTGLSVDFLGDTGDSAGFKWVLFGATIQPADKAALAAWFTLDPTGAGIMAQILTGTRTALVARDADDCIAQAAHGIEVSAAGVIARPPIIPFDILAPMPVMSRKLTVGIVGFVNAPGLASERWIARLLWGMDTLGRGDANAFMQTKISD